MSEEPKKTCKYFNYVEQLLILISAVIVCVSISAFTSSVAVTITAGIKQYKSVIKKKKKHDKIVLLVNTKLNTIEVLNCKSLIDSYISHDEFASVNNLLRKYNEMKEEIKNSESSVKYNIQVWLI